MSAAFAMVIVACLAGGGQCSEHRVPMPNQMTCVVFGQVELVEWLETNPGYTAKSWRCEEPGA